MFPFPMTFLVTEGGVIPLPDGSVQKVVTLDYTSSGNVRGTTLAILLKDGRLFMQGTNAYGEIADSTRNTRYTNFYLSATGVADICRGDRCFLVKYNSGGWQYAGLLAGLVGSTAAGGADVVATAWTSLPSSITGTVTLANLKEVKGGLNNTIWWMTDGRLYGSGENTSGSLGSGNTSQVNIPRTISTVALKCEAEENQVTYLNNLGNLRVCGMTRGLLGTGSSTTVSSFASATVAAGLYVKDYVSDITQTLVVGASSASDTVNSMYYRGWNATTYTKLTAFDPGFANWAFLPGRQALFFTINGKLWGIGQNYTGSLGTGTKGTGGGTIVPQEPLVPDGTGTQWQVDKINYVNVTNMSINATIGYLFPFMLYNGNLYYTGTTVDSITCPLFNTTLNSLVWTPIPDANIVGTTATAISTDSIGIAIVGGTQQLTYSVTPNNGLIQDIKYTTSNAAHMTINAAGLMTFTGEGGFDAGMTAKNNEGTTLSDSSGGYASTLSVYTDSLSAMDVGTTQQLVATISPSGAATIPGMVVTYTTTDAAVATVSSTGLISGVADGDCRIGCTATYQGTVVASDSSYLAVNAVAPAKPVPFDSTDWELVVGPGRLYLSGGLATTAYSVDWGNGSAVQAHTTSGGIIYKDYTGAATARWTVKVSIPEANLLNNVHSIMGTALIEVKKWPTKVIQGVTFYSAGGSVNLVKVPTYLPPAWTNLSTSIAGMFQGCTSFNQDISMWDMTNIKTVANMFNGATAFAQPLRWWDTRNVTDMSGMFIGAASFNHAINDWNTSKVTTMQGMFSGYNCIFNQPIGNWDLTSLKDIRDMFFNNRYFDQDISAWKPTTKITSTYRQNWDKGSLATWTADKKPTFTA